MTQPPEEPTKGTAEFHQAVRQREFRAMADIFETRTGFHVNLSGTSYHVFGHISRYRESEAIAVQIRSHYELFGILTFNHELAVPRLGQIFVKTWSENDPWAHDLMKTLPQFKFVDYIPTGMTQGEIWELKTFTP